MDWVVQLPILFLSIMGHEVAHGLVALRNGDDTAKRAGRLTFNPLAHIDPIGTVVLPVICLLAGLPLIGWARPVPVEATHLISPRWAMLRVALVGPASNIGLSFVAALIFRAAAAIPASALQAAVLNAMLFAVMINLFLAYFNLIPIHPLDGSKVLRGLLPPEWRARYDRHLPYGFLIILLLVCFGLIGALVRRPSLLTLELYARLGLIW